MDLCSLIQSKRQGLKACKTTVTDMRGERYEIVNGEMKRMEKGLPFIVDTKPDLQVACVAPGLFFGSQDPAVTMDLLRNHEIRHILSIGVDLHIKFKDIQYHYVDLLDLPEANIVNTLKTCVRIIYCNRSENIFVHCNAGVSRSASIVIGYLMISEDLTYELAYEKVKLARGCIKPNEGFVRQLRILNRSDFV